MPPIILSNSPKFHEATIPEKHIFHIFYKSRSQSDVERCRATSSASNHQLILAITLKCLLTLNGTTPSHHPWPTMCLLSSYKTDPPLLEVDQQKLIYDQIKALHSLKVTILATFFCVVGASPFYRIRNLSAVYNILSHQIEDILNIEETLTLYFIALGSTWCLSLLVKTLQPYFPQIKAQRTVIGWLIFCTVTSYMRRKKNRHRTYPS